MCIYIYILHMLIHIYYKCAHTCVYIYIYIYIYMYVCMYIYICIYIYTHTSIHTYRHIWFLSHARWPRITQGANCGSHSRALLGRSSRKMQNTYRQPYCWLMTGCILVMGTSDPWARQWIMFTIVVWQRMSLLLASNTGCLYEWRLTKEYFTTYTPDIIQGLNEWCRGVGAQTKDCRSNTLLGTKSGEPSVANGYQHIYVEIRDLHWAVRFKHKAAKPKTYHPTATKPQSQQVVKSGLKWLK